MQTETDIYTIYLDGWALRVKRPQVSGSGRVTLLIHGWTGDENSMWVFARSLPAQTWVLAPRGPVTAPDGGYGWVSLDERANPLYPDYARSAQQLIQRLKTWLAHFKLNPSQINLMGFSMGAAMVFTLLSEEPGLFDRCAGLAGYLPSGLEQILTPGRLSGKEIFIAHGSQDETVPVVKAHEAAHVLKQAGASVLYCEDNVGHKLGAACQRGLSSFFNPA